MNLKTNRYYANEAFENWKDSDLCDPDVVKLADKERIIELIQELEQPICDLAVARIVKANRSKLIGEIKMPQQKTQTPEQRVQVLRDYFTNDFPKCFPHLEQILDANGKITCKPSYVLMFDAIRGLEFVRKDLVNEILLDLDSKELLVRKGPERIVEVEKPVDPKVEKKRKFQEAHDAGLLNSAKHNRSELDDEWKGGKSRPLPLSEQERVAINSRNARVDEVIKDTMSSIERYTGPNHARTFERRGELTALFDKFKFQVKDEESALKLQRTVDEKINSYDRSSSGGIR